MSGEISKTRERASNVSLIGQVLVLVALCVFIGVCHLRINQLQAEASNSDVSIPNVQLVKLASLGYDQLVADLYWLAFVQYTGDRLSREKDKGPLSYQYLDLITELDPHFMQAYWYTAFVIGGEQRNPKLAAELLERGLQANTDDWYMPFIAGINQYLYAKNELAAAKYYRIAAKYEGAPDWLERQASILEAKIPSTIKEINIWTNVSESAEEPRVKEHAKEQLLRLWIQVYKTSPTEAIKKRAREALFGLGVDVAGFAQPNK